MTQPIFQPVVHGGSTDLERARLALAGIELLDLSANVNPYGPHPAVLAAARQAALDRYPSPDAAELRAGYAAARALDPSQVLAANGSSEVIYLTARAFASGGRCLIAGPTFGEYAAAARAAGADVEQVDAVPTGGFPVPMTDLLTRIDSWRPSLVIVCNPNNPTAQLAPSEAIALLNERTLNSGGTLAVDEAYMDFAGLEADPAAVAPGRVIIRSMTKLHAIPGLRIGFLCGPEDLIARVRPLQPPWSVSAPAAAAALAALKLRDWEADCVEKTVAAREHLLTGLRHRNWETVDSHANFMLVRSLSGAALRERLLARGFAVRDCASFGLPEYVRVAVPKLEVVDGLLEAFGIFE